MEIAGHKTRAIFDRYHIVSDRDLQEAARKLGEAFSAQKDIGLGTNGLSAPSDSAVSASLVWRRSSVG